MTIQKFNSFFIKNTWACKDLIYLLREEGVHIELTHEMISSHHDHEKMEKALSLMKEADLVKIIEKDFTYKKRCSKTAMLIPTVEKRKYYQLEDFS